MPSSLEARSRTALAQDPLLGLEVAQEPPPTINVDMEAGPVQAPLVSLEAVES